jgi:hypothetical protein
MPPKPNVITLSTAATTLGQGDTSIADSDLVVVTIN